MAITLYKEKAPVRGVLFDVDDTDYKRILEIFKKYDVRYFFYNGGNDSMDTCNKVSKYMAKVGYDCRVIGVPKTIDNDLAGTDHCPGFASAAKYIATSFMEVSRDSKVYDTGMVTVIECMGRHAGWLTAAAALAGTKGDGPDLVYLPEVDFDMDKFLADVERVYNEKKNCLVAVSLNLVQHYQHFVGIVYYHSQQFLALQGWFGVEHGVIHFLWVAVLEGVFLADV